MKWFLLLILLNPNILLAETLHFSHLLSAIPNTTSKTYIIPVDEFYNIPTDEEVFDKLIRLEYHNYTKDFADCDDFVFEAKGFLSFTGWPIAFVAIKGHYMLAWFNNERRWVFVDPQGIKIREPPKDILIFIF